MNPKDFDRWMTTLSDEARADVMKTTITATEETKRVLEVDSDYNITRRLRVFVPCAMIVLVATLFFGRSCTQLDRELAAEQMRIQAEHPAAFPDAGK
jgi:hypothetical protein